MKTHQATEVLGVEPQYTFNFLTRCQLGGGWFEKFNLSNTQPAESAKILGRRSGLVVIFGQRYGSTGLPDLLLEILLTNQVT